MYSPERRTRWGCRLFEGGGGDPRAGVTFRLFSENLEKRRCARQVQ